MDKLVIIIDSTEARRVSFLNAISELFPEHVQSFTEIDDALSRFIELEGYAGSINVFLIIHYGNRIENNRVIAGTGRSVGNIKSASFVEDIASEFSNINLKVLAYSGGSSEQLGLIANMEKYPIAKKIIDPLETDFTFLRGVFEFSDISGLAESIGEFISAGNIDLSQVKSKKYDSFDQKRSKFVHDFLKNKLITKVNKELTKCKMQRSKYIIAKESSVLEEGVIGLLNEELNKLPKKISEEITEHVKALQEKFLTVKTFEETNDIAEFEKVLKELKLNIEEISLLTSCTVNVE